MGKMLNKISIILLIYLILPFYFSSQIFIIFASIYLIYNIIFFRIKISKKVFSIISIFLILNLIGIINGVIKNNNVRDLLRDMVNFLLPIVSILSGYIIILKEKNQNKLLNTFIVAATFLSSVHLIQLLSNISSASSLRGIRLSAGNGNILSVIAVVMLFNNRQYKLNLLSNKRKRILICFLVNFISFILSLSRSLILVFIIMIIFTNIYKFKLNKKFTMNYLKLSIIIFSSLIIVPFIIYLAKHNTVFIQFIEKITNSFSEISSNNKWDWNSINSNWRGYEAYRAKILYNDSGIIEKLIGNGFGSRVPLGLEMKLSGEIFSSVPILHNGYMYILTKNGMLGLFLYVIALIIILINSLKVNMIRNNFINKLIISIAITEIVLTVFSTGMLGYSYSAMNILIGLSLGHMYRYDKIL